jgi:hypothetical protein
MARTVSIGLAVDLTFELDLEATLKAAGGAMCRAERSRV